MTEMADLYDACLGEVDRLVADLMPEQLATVVSATPAWTVHQLIAHLAGSAVDATSGRMDGAPGPEWTARHVAELEDRSPAELAAALRSTQDAIAASTEGNPRPAIVWNISVHLADVHEALGLPVLDAALWTRCSRPWRRTVSRRRRPGSAAGTRCGGAGTPRPKCRRTSCSGRCSPVAPAPRCRRGGAPRSPRSSSTTCRCSGRATTTSRSPPER